jgi:basic membrane protein A
LELQIFKRIRSKIKKINSSITVDTQYVSEAPDYSGLSDPNKARKIAVEMISKGVDIIFSPSGGSIVGVADLARDSQAVGKKFLVIGNDQDLYLKHCSSQSADMDCKYILTSVVKNLSETVFDVVARYSASGALSTEIEPRTRGQRFGVAERAFSLSRIGGLLEGFWSSIESEIQLLREGKVKVPSAP